MVEEIVPNSRVTYAEGASPDKRNYRVNCDKICRELPEYQPRWTVRLGVEELYEAYKRHGLTYDEFVSSRYLRIKHVRGLIEKKRLDTRLRWVGNERTAGDEAR
jgi:hypothetical protein